MFFRLKCVLFCLVMCMGMMAQSKFDIKGIIIDNETSDPMEGATVQLFSLPDSTFVVGAMANDKGGFRLEGVKKNKYVLKVSMIGYVSMFVDLNLNDKKTKVIELGTLTMLDNAHLMNEAVVSAAASKVQVSGDSLVYNASAYRVPEGSTLEALIRLLPGAKVDEDGKITINGNTKLYEHVVRREMRVKPGALYSQSDLVRTLRELAQLGQFDEEKIYSGVDLKPDIETGTVDIDFNLESKQSDQVEFSAGVGQSGLVLTLGLKFTNFAIQNIFKPKTYRIVPQGEGQTLSLRVQLNGIYYQNYSISLYVPWIGGKRPNSLTMSLYYAVQTGLSNRAYTNYSNMSNYYQYYYGYSDNTYGYSSNSWGTEYDKNVYMRTLGASIGFGTRLKWPDDFFQFFVELSYQRHHLNNWFKYYYGFETGTTNDLALGLTLQRNSISNPIYTRRGSNISLSVQATLPYSLFPSNKDKDYGNMDLAAKNNWVEYHKWKFKAQFFTPLSHNEKLVLMTKVEYGFLGYYNPDKRSSFGKFLVGGDGTSGYTTPGSELVSLRGYDSGTLTPYSGEGYYGYNGNLYTKFSVEVRYPLLLKPTSTIWVLGFFDAGNCWSEFKEFNPFELRRSAGAGVRVFLPMFGLLGVDWGWGFDKDQTGTLGGSHFHFILGQEF